MTAIAQSITIGLGWGFGFLTTSHEVLPLVPITLFQAIFTAIVGVHGVLFFICHGICNPDTLTLWKSMLNPSKMKQVHILTKSVGNSKTKQASIPTSDNMWLSYSCSSIKSPPLTFSEYSSFTCTNIEVEANPSYGNIKDYKSEKLITLDKNAAYEVVKRDLLIEDEVYETLH